MRVLPPNTADRDLVVGDIHGYIDELSLLLTHHEFRKDRDRLFSVGDLIDRGRNSVEVLRLSQEPWFFPVRGKREQLMIDAVCSGQFSDGITNGGDWCLDVEQNALREMVRVVLQWPFAITINHRSGKRIGVCHAQPPINQGPLSELSHMMPMSDTKCFGADPVYTTRKPPLLK